MTDKIGVNGSKCDNIADNKKSNSVSDTDNDKSTYAFEDALEIAVKGRYSYSILTIVIYSLLAATAEMFTIGIVTTAAQCDLDLDVNKKGLMSSIPILGVVVSAHLWGFLADTRGRRFTLIISTAATCVAGLLAAFSGNWIYLAGIKFIGAIFASGTNAISYTFLGETTVANKRQLYLMYCTGGMLSFQAFNALAAYPVLNMTFSYYMPLLGYAFRPWRLFLLGIGLVSGINLLLIVFFTFESPKFYFAIGEHDKGLKIMQKIYKVNTGNVVEDYPVKHVVLNADDYKPKQRSFFRSVWEQTTPLFNKKYITSTILIFLCCLPSYCVSPPFSIWLPFIMNSVSKVQDTKVQFCDIFKINDTKTISYNGTEIQDCDDTIADLALITLAIFAIYLLCCTLIACVMIKYIGKKWTFVSTHFVCAVLCGIINYVNMLGGVISLVGMTANVACMGIVTTYAIELFPTYMRAMAVCLCILFGRAVSIVFYNVIGAQLQTNCFNFIFILTALIAFGGCVGLFLPSDRAKQEVDNVEDKTKEKASSTMRMPNHATAETILMKGFIQ